MSIECYFKDMDLISRIRLGPLGKYIELYAKQLHDYHYNRDTSAAHICVVADFAQWLKKSRISFDKIKPKHIQKYLSYRRKKNKSPFCDVSATRKFYVLLQEQGVCLKAIAQKTTRELLIDNYVEYLRQDRGLSPRTIEYYHLYALKFLDKTFPAEEFDLSSLQAESVLAFVHLQAQLCPCTAKKLVTALRSFFRYLRYRGMIELDLAAAVPKVAHWRKTDIPRSISPDEVKRVLSAYQGETVQELRANAILRLLAHLGLRAGEIVSLKLDDIDWKAGCINVKGKGGRTVKMPLPFAVGESVSSYLLHGRRRSKSRSLFLRLIAPFVGITPATISTEVQRILKQIGINSPKQGAHQFRHYLATELLREGASLTEIGELLRHSSPQATEVYAKVDFKALAALAMPWPGAVK